MSDGVKYLLRCVGLYIITFVFFCSGFMYYVEGTTMHTVLFLMCMWVLGILQIVNFVNGDRDRNCSDEEWNMIIEVLFVIASMSYIVFCGFFLVSLTLLFLQGMIR